MSINAGNTNTAASAHWYAQCDSLSDRAEWRLSECVLASSQFRTQIPSPNRTLGSELLLLASLENWELKIDNFCLMANVSRPTGRKLVKSYLQYGLAISDDNGNLFASKALQAACDARAKDFLNTYNETSGTSYEASSRTLSGIKHALIRTDFAANMGLLPCSTIKFVGLLAVHMGVNSGPRRTRSVIESHQNLTGEDLEPTLRRWILLGWVESSDEHFFNDRFLMPTALGTSIVKQFIATLGSCLIKTGVPELVR